MAPFQLDQFNLLGRSRPSQLYRYLAEACLTVPDSVALSIKSFFVGMQLPKIPNSPCSLDLCQKKRT